MVLSDKSDISSTVGNGVPVTIADTVSSETTVSQVRHYNNILSKTVTTVERDDTVYAPVVRWNLAFNIGALSGGRKENGAAKKALGLPPVKFEAKYPTIYFGLVDNSSDAFSVDLTRSSEVGMYLLKGGWTIYQKDADNVYGVTAALGFSYTNLALDDKDVFYVDEEGMTVCAPLEDLVYHKPRMNYWSYRLPVSFQWSCRMGRSVGFFSFGVEAEYRHHIRSYISVRGDADHRMASHSLAVTPWSGNYLMQAGRGNWGFLVRGSFTGFFDKKSTDLRGQTVLVGISLTF